MVLSTLGVKPWSEWDPAEKKPGKRLGTSYTIVKLKAKGPVLVNVKIAGDPVVTDEEIRDNYKAQVVTWVDFADYDEDSYIRNGVTYYTATATVATRVAGNDDVLDLT